MGACWRYLEDDGVEASFGLAVDEWMASRSDGPPALRLYTYASHCVLIGRYQRLDSEVHVEVCRTLGVALNRRPTGGGAILMGADQLGLALTIPAGMRAVFPRRAQELFPALAAGLVEGLRALGIAAAFHRKNDLEVRGRKIAGLGLYAAPAGGLLFHASLLVDLDLPLMLRVLHTPFEKLADKGVATLADRMTTVRRETGRALGVPEVRERIAGGYARAFGVTLEPGSLTAAERSAVEALERGKYLTAAWLEQPGLVPEAGGSCRLKTPGGLVEVHLTLRQNAIASCCVTGDFFAEEGRLAELERRLRRAAADPATVRETLERLYTEGLGIPGVAPEALAAAVDGAVRDAAARRACGIPYGCFVNP